MCTAFIVNLNKFITSFLLSEKNVDKVKLKLDVFFHQVRRIIMSPVKDPNVELVIVMFIVPLVVNVSHMNKGI